MNINDKRLMDMAEQLGFGKKSSKAEGVADLADKYKGKSDQELIDEIMKVKRTIKKDKVQYEKQMKAIKALGAMMSGEQKIRLEKLIRLLESDD